MTLVTIALVAAFIPSAIRLYHIGSQTFGNSIDDPVSAHLVGISVVIMAEVSQLVFSLSLAVFGASRTSRRLLYFSMIVATAIALIGNVQVALPNHWTNPFAWLEAIAPPILVLSLAYVLKEQMLEAIKSRFANEQAYQQALHEWMEATKAPEKHPKYQQYLANALRDEIVQSNKRKKIIKDDMLSVRDWRMLVLRELNQENWFIDDDGATSTHFLPIAEIQTRKVDGTNSQKQSDDIVSLPTLHEGGEETNAPLAVTSNGHKPT